MTRFTYRFGIYKFEATSFDLIKALVTFQQMLTKTLKNVQCRRVYLNAVVVFSSSEVQHLQDVVQVLKRYSDTGLRINLKACFFWRSEARSFGHVNSNHGVNFKDGEIKSIVLIPAPTLITELKSFFGIASYYRRIIRIFAKL